ncbi:DNA polymerase ligase N-terminal domain-containing protein [Ottowia sp. VDI28]|uniref:DNA polymerase ligase N-terminal domain-containing protein n=1 Tax=Ottowia sp. VDI28 TaxID=3133968 RepID=UPI003C2F543A
MATRRPSQPAARHAPANAPEAAPRTQKQKHASALSRYQARRDFTRTPEPSGKGHGPISQYRYVVQKHWASRLHYDFRLEVDGTMKSWAVPKGPSLDPRDKRLAVEVEDHPVEYNDFEGQIPAGQYGGGRVIIWDRGIWSPLPGHEPRKGLKAGNFKFQLHGLKLRGNWALVRLKGTQAKAHWLLIKEKDDAARPVGEFSVTEALPDSVSAGLPLEAPLRLFLRRPCAKANHSPSSSPRNSLPSPTPCLQAPVIGCGS